MKTVLDAMQRISLASLLVVLPVHSESSVAIVPGSRIERGIQARSDQAAREIQAGGAYLRLEAGGAKPDYGLLFWLWDPDTRLFLWNFLYRGANPVPNPGNFEWLVSGARVQITESAIHYFTLSFTDLWVQKSDERFATTEGGIADALQVIEANLPKIPDESFQHTARRLPLRDAIPVDFFYQPLSASAATVSRMTSVKRQGDGWRVELEGEGSRRAVVLLNSNLELVEAKEVKP